MSERPERQTRLRHHGRPSTGTPSLPGERHQLEARLQKNGTTILTVDGAEVARGGAQTLSIHPAGVMQLGGVPDKHLPVGNYQPPFSFDGDIESVTVEFGDKSL